MKKIILNLMAAGAAGWLISVSAQPAPGDNNDTNAPADQTPPASGDAAAPTNAPDAAPDASGAPAPDDMTSASDMATNDAAPEDGTVKDSAVHLPGATPAADGNIVSDFNAPTQPSGTNNPDELRLNFRNAPLDMVLNYLSDAAGFTIVLETRVNGNVSVISNHPMTRDAAVDLLNTILNQNGYAAIRDGQTLTILDKNDAKTSRIPVKTGNDPTGIPNNAEIVTQIIPIRFVDARQLVSDLTSFVSPQATVVANEEGNSIVITDTQSNIRHLTEIIRAIDDSAEAETEIKVFPLKYANPNDVATELGSIFPNSTSGGTQNPTSFGGGGRGGRGGAGGGGPGGFFAAMMGGGASSSGGSSADRIKKATQVTAVADLRIQAVVVTAPKDLMGEIAKMMDELDVPSDRDQDVTVIPMANGDPQQALQVLQSMFQNSSSARNSSSSQNNSALQTRSTSTASSMGSTTTGTGLSGSSSSFGGSRGGGY